MIFNINNYIEIKLTQYGKDILKEKEDKIFTEYPSLKEYLYKYKVNNRGYLKLQLWEVMNIFGSYLGTCCDAPFEMDIKIKSSDVEVDQEEAKQIFIESVAKSVYNHRDPYHSEDEHTIYSNGVMNTIEAVVEPLVKNVIIWDCIEF